MKLLLRILKIAIIICLFIVLVNSLFGAHDLEELMSVELWGTYFFYCIVLTALNAVYFHYFREKIGWEQAGIQRVILASLGSVVITLVGYFFCRLVTRTVFEDVPFQEFLENESVTYYILPLLFTVVISLFFHIIFFYKALQEQKVTEQKIIAGTASAKFESLKNQLDPHFLFNCLNVLSSLIEENPEKAQKFTTSLSKIYRYVLEQKDKELVKLEEELRFAETFVRLLKMRFEDSIFLEISEEPMDPEARVVPLSLQLLLENTVKHNVVSQQRPLKIRIYPEDKYLVIENNLQKKEVLQTRKGVGIQNIVDRYAQVTRREVLLEELENKFIVKLPILTKQLSIMQTQEENSYFKAKQRVREMKEFYGNLLSFCVVIPFLIFINYRTYWEFQWFWFPLLGWGLGLTIQGFSTFGYGAVWEEKKIQEIMEKEQQQQTKNWN